MTVGIYGIFDKRDDTCLYVGQSKDIAERWKGHLKNLRSGKHIRKDFVTWFESYDKDPESIRFEILEPCLNDDVVKKCHRNALVPRTESTILWKDANN